MPITGVMPASLACRWNSAAANMLPWSVIARCVMPWLLTSANRSFSRAAPSSMEYSEVGHRQVRHALALDLREQVLQPGRPVQHGVLGVHVQVSERGLGRRDRHGRAASSGHANATPHTGGLTGP